MIIRNVLGVLNVMTLLTWLGKASVVQLTASNLDHILATNELVFINFYADWCRFSQMLTPIFEETSKKMKEEFPDDGKLTFGRIDCDREGALAGRFHVSKYPTLKMFRFGSLVKREYRGQRSVGALGDYVRGQLNVPVKVLNSQDDVFNIDIRKRSMIGYYEGTEGPEYVTFLRIASLLRDDCSFYASLGPVPEGESVNKVVFRGPGEELNEEAYNGSVADYNALVHWASEKCVPVVRELTFENAEELTEEGLPFLILFHHPDDSDTPERFRRTVAAEFGKEKTSVNFLVANGLKFSHPLHHLGKTAKDLPVLAIDSFRHMYVWPRSPQADIDKPGLLKQFIADLNSGKLHREFHQGPDPTTKPPAPPPIEHKEEKAEEIPVEKKPSPPQAGDHVPKEVDTGDVTAQQVTKSEARTSPPESLFRKLAPSRTRYTILRDEL